MPDQRILDVKLKVAQKHHKTMPLRKHLDIGPGEGHLIKMYQEKFDTMSWACDCTTERMKMINQSIDLVDLNVDKKLPYTDASFDVVTATEVIEHLHDYRTIIQEINRVLTPGGLCLLSVPNVLNINSRLRNLMFGFPVLYGPLPVKERSRGSTEGHITIIPFFYLAHALLEQNFSEVNFYHDKFQRSGLLKLLFWYFPIKIFGWFAWRREIFKYNTIDQSNASLIQAMNSTSMLLGRNIIVSGVKPYHREAP